MFANHRKREYLKLACFLMMTEMKTSFFGRRHKK